MSAVTRMESLTANPVLGSRTMLDCAKSHQPWDFLLAENLQDNDAISVDFGLHRQPVYLTFLEIERRW